MTTRITIADVAREAGVSAQTVSRVINNKAEISPSTRELVSSVIERLGYRPSSIARSLATSRTFTLGLSVPDIANPVYPEIARGAEDVAWEQGYNLFLCNTTEDPTREAAVLRLLEEKRVDGVIVAGSRLPDDQLMTLLEGQAAAVLINRPAPAHLAGVVLVDAIGGARCAVEHLMARGRKTIAFLAGPEFAHNSRRHREGYGSALLAAGRVVADELIIGGEPTIEGGRQAAKLLLQRRPDVDAIYCYNDLIAIGVLEVCASSGRSVPSDIAVIGYDDILLAQMTRPPLTTLRAMKYDIGVAAARMLIDRIAGRAERNEVIIPTELVLRESAP